MENDTIKLLKECNSGCKMATNSIEQVLPYIYNEELKKLLTKYNAKHIALGEQSHKQLEACHAHEEDPTAMASAFSWFTTELKLLVNDTDKEVSSIMMKGCSMGIESISQYINEYTEADNDSISLAHKLVNAEEDFMHDLEQYL